jgi:hypothetical protein
MKLLTPMFAAAREIQIGRFNPNLNVNLNANLHASADLAIIIPSYVFATPVLGGQLAVQRRMCRDAFVASGCQVSGPEHLPGRTGLGGRVSLLHLLAPAPTSRSGSRPSRAMSSGPFPSGAKPSRRPPAFTATAGPRGWSWQPFRPAVPSATQGSATSSSIGRQRPRRSGSSLAKAASTYRRWLLPTVDLAQRGHLAGRMPPPRPGRRRHHQRSRRQSQTPSNTARPNSDLGSAKPSVRWINQRACPASRSRFAIESASGNDRQPEGRTEPAAASLRHRLRRRPLKTLVSHPTTCVAVDRCSQGFRFLEHRQRSGRSTSSA